MKKLDFSGSTGPENYEMLYDGIINSSRGLEAPSETRILGRILDKMEAIGETSERNGVKTFSLAKQDSQSVLLDEMEFKLFTEMIKVVRWTARGARKATEAVELLEKAPEVEVTEKK